MARPFSSNDAKQIIKKHQTLLDSMNNAINLSNTHTEKIKALATKLVEAELSETLKSIPVEELAKSKSGIRIKTLRDNNYCTISDLQKASLLKISSINGISDEGSASIKKAVADIVEKTRKETKIKLNADNKTTSSSELILAIYIYKNSIENIKKCRMLLEQNQSQILSAIKDLGSSASTFKWFFSSKSAKEQSSKAFDFLFSLANPDSTTDPNTTLTYVREKEPSKNKYSQTNSTNNNPATVKSTGNALYGITAQALLSDLDEINKTKTSVAWTDFTQDSVTYNSILEDLCPGMVGSDDAIYGLPEELALEIQNEPIYSEGLNCTLRRYQEWGVKYILHQKRVLLGDEMGLGKTVQAIAAMVSLSNRGKTHFIVICPASVVTNWCREISKHSNLNVIKMHGSDRDYALNTWMNTGGALVTTFETTGHINFADGITYDQLIVDEAHYIKNPEAQRSINTTKLCSHAERILFMTGTALENKVEEMITLIEILQPGIAKEVSNIAFLSSAPEFREKIAPVYYRRRREDVLTELPELIETKEWCKLLPKEEKIYEQAVLNKKYSDARRVSWNIDNLENSSKAQRLLEIVEEAEAEGRKVLIFSFFLDTINKINSFLGERCMEAINGSVAPQRRQEIIDEFTKAPAGAVLTAQIQSGGTGLNIQAASVVIICEPQFKPSIENQAIARAYRMGQARNVLVYRLLSDDTIEEKISDVLEQKQKIFDTFADTSVVAEESFELDEKTFGSIMDSEAERIAAKNSKQ